MPLNGLAADTGASDEAVVPVSSLRGRWEALSRDGSPSPKPGPSVPSSVAGRAASRTVSVPFRKDKPTTRVITADQDDGPQVNPPSGSSPSGVELANGLRPRVASNPISPNRRPEPLPPSPQPSPPLRPTSMATASSHSSPGLTYAPPRLPTKMASSQNVSTPTQADFPPTPKQSPPSPSRANGSGQLPLREPSPTGLPPPVKKAPPPPPPSRSTKPQRIPTATETKPEPAHVTTLGASLSSSSAGEDEAPTSVASLRSMFGGTAKTSAPSTPAFTPSPSISRTTSVSSTVSSSHPPPLPTTRPAQSSQPSPQPKLPPQPVGGPSIPRRPSAASVVARPAPPRPPSRAPSMASTSSNSPTELSGSPEATGYAFPEILDTPSLVPSSAVLPSLPPRPKPQVPARPVATTSSQPPPTNGVPNGAGEVRPKPALPARKQAALGSGSEGSAEGGPPPDPGPPPPIPDNRPVLDRPPTAAPPRLPTRAKTITPSRRRVDPDLDLGPYVPPPPPPPPSHTARLDRATSLASNRGGSRSTSRQTSPLPPSSRELVPDLDDGYRPPPPPVRKATLPVHADLPPPARRRSADVVSEDELGEGSDDEDDGEPGLADAAYVPSSKQFKKVDDLPDPTLSNRRPPVLRLRPVRIIGSSGSHHLTSFASCGDYVAVGSHHLRVYNVDDHSEQGPVLLWDQKEMGLDVKSKDPRITALCFRPVLDEGETARYLWCGSKDGHLWEVDVWGAAVIQTRSHCHPSPITQIYKYKQSTLTLDDTGKACLFTMNEGGSFNINVPTQNLRIAERQTFTTLLGHQLWTASGPISTSSSIKSAASRGPTIRVYEPFDDSPLGPGGRVLSVPDTVTGAVTSATIIPSKPHLVYIGHEGGHVSIWARDTFVCISVLKISTSAIISLAGVGSKLWAGTRKGVVNVYDVESRPWTITNLWKAHDGSPVLGFEVDVLSMNKGYLRVYSWGRDNCIQGWDGLLSDDWQESKLLERESEFCSYRELTVLSCSWNIDASKPEQLTGTTDNAGFLTSVLTSEDSPDVIVFGFQELIDLDDKKLQAKTLLFGKSKAANGEMSEKVSQRYRLWHDKLVQAVRVAMPPHAPYTVVHAQNLVGLFTCIFVKNAEMLNLRDVAITTVKRGMAGMYGNKGAIIARFVIDDSSVCFINCHLAAGQRQKTARNADLASILDEESRFPVVLDDQLAYAGGGDGSMILDHDLCFLQGDLNYRIDLRRENVISSLRAGERAYLLEHDQLLKEMRTNSSFRLRTFNEAPIAFDPTYKYDRNSDQYDSSEKKRVPAWCDRILFRSRVPENIEPLHYKRYEPTVSDHRPISAGFLVKVRKVQPQSRSAVLAEVRQVWEDEKVPVLLEEAKGFYGSL